MNNISTAEEYMEQHEGASIQRLMIEFAKLHLQAQQEAILKKAECIPVEGITDDYQIDPNSITSAYNINDIK